VDPGLEVKSMHSVAFPATHFCTLMVCKKGCQDACLLENESVMHSALRQLFLLSPLSMELVSRVLVAKRAN
jgi:hypothetical protein